MTVFFQNIVIGIAIGSAYALIGGSFALIYGTTRHFHLAHAATYEIAGFGAYALWNRFHIPLLPSLFIAILFASLTSVAYPLVLYPPIQRRSRGLFGIFVVGTGLYIVIDNIFPLWLGSSPLLGTVGPSLTKAVSNTGILTISWLQVLFIGLAVAWLVLVGGYLRFSGMGLLTRAYSRNDELIRILGYRPGLIASSAYVLGSIGMGIAAYYGFFTSGIAAQSGESALLYGFLAAFVTSRIGVGMAFGAGLIIGVGESLASAYVGGDWPTAIIVGAFSLILLGRSVNWVRVSAVARGWSQGLRPRAPESV